ncbi:MAG: lytic transglycosylase domain-containing protein [bacterium]|nr:lytic transglycosylase domain-containing protein [bacterium]
MAMIATAGFRRFLFVPVLVLGFSSLPAVHDLRAEEGIMLAGEDSADKKAKATPRLVKRKNSRVPKKRISYKRSGICKDLDKLARKYKLPPLFFARLIWQESRFNPYAVSPAGAEGIAQFMPGTAAIWGLDDPFEPGQALVKSAQYLSYLHKKLGNIGFAAAGYNAGSGRVTDWLNGSNYMPLETRNYVRIITGYSIEAWTDGTARFVGIKVPKKMSATACRQLSIALRNEQPRLIKASLNRAGTRLGKTEFRRHTRRARRLPRLPWGVQLAGSFSRRVAMNQFNNIKRKYGRVIGAKRIVLKSSRQKGRGRRVFHRVRVGAKSRGAADKICTRLRAAGGSCVVLKN